MGVIGWTLLAAFVLVILGAVATILYPTTDANPAAVALWVGAGVAVLCAGCAGFNAL